MAYILEKIGNTYNLPKKYFTCDAKSDLDGISLVDVPIGSEAYCILEEESYILDSNKQWHKKKIGEDLTGSVTTQADWSINDEINPAYVRNRPFYDTDESTDTVILEEITVGKFIENNGAYIFQTDPPTSIQAFELEKQYYVTWDGIEYIVSGKLYAGTGYAIIGNTMIVDGIDSGEPFAILVIPNEVMIFVSYVEGTYHTVSITSREYVSVKLPARFYDKPIYTITVSYNHYNDVYTMTTGNYEEAYTAYQKGWYVNMRLIGSYDSIIPCVSKDGSNLIFSDSDHFDSSDVYMSQIRLDSNGNVSKIYTRVATTKYILDNFQKKLIGTESQYVSFDADGNAVAKDRPNYTTMELKTLTEMPTSHSWCAIAYGNEVYVTLGENTTDAAYSTDGINWVASNTPFSSYWTSNAYGNGIFVAISQSGNPHLAIYSTDGITWNSSRMPVDTTWTNIAYGNGKFVAIAANQYYGAYSTDGVAWTEFSMPNSESYTDLIYGNDKFIAIANGDYGYYSTDGIAWTKFNMPDLYWNSVTYGNGIFVAVSGARNSPRDILAYSTNGITWNSSRMPSSEVWFKVAYGAGKFIALALSGNCAYSEDGINWTSFFISEFTSYVDLIYGKDKFIIIDNSTNQVVFSYDGINWQTNLKFISQNNSNITESVRSVIGIPSYSTANNGQFLRVIDGIPTWTTIANAEGGTY